MSPSLHSTPDAALQETVRALAAFAEGRPEMDRLLAETVRRAGGALNAGGAAIWVTEAADHPELVLEHQLSALGLADDGQALPGLVLAVRRCAREGKPLIVPSFFVDNESNDLPVNPTPYELLFIPLRLHGKVAMVLAVAVPPTGDGNQHRTQITFLQRMAAVVETKLTERHLKQLEKDRGVAGKIVQFAQHVHKHLKLPQVAIDIANLVRDVIGAQRVTVELYPRFRRKVVAVSNVDEPNKRGAIFQVQRLIFDYVRDRNVPAMLDREAARSLVSDPQLQDAAVGYFVATQFDAFIAAPIREGDTVIGVVLAEYASTQKAQQNAGVLSDLARISASAVTNAIEYESIPLRRAMCAVRELYRKPTSTRRKVMLSVAGGLLAMLLVVGVIPFDFAIKADCTVQPRAQMAIVAPDDGRIIDVPVRAGQRVYPASARETLGDAVVPLAVLDTTDLLAQRAAQQQQLAELQVQLKDLQAKGDIAKLGGVQLQIKQVEDQIKLLDHRIAQATIYAPIEGTVLTENVEQRKWSSVKMGDPLMEVASFDDWVLVIDIPESEVATVRGALDESAQDAAAAGRPDPGIEVEYIFYPWPDKRFSIKARGVGVLLPAAAQANNKNVFRLYVPVNRNDLPPGIAMAGVTGRAKIHCGKKPLFTQWTRGVTRLLQMTAFF